jgi:hypothetical protein
MGMIDALAIRVGLITASLLAAGCVSYRQAYPQGWPSIDTPIGQTCAQIANTYQNWGRTASHLYSNTSGRPASLTQVLFGDVANQSQADRITFSFPQVGHLQLVVSGSTGQLFSDVLTSESGKFTCQKGTVIMRQGARWRINGAPGGVGRFTTRFELHPMNDYLVVEEQQHGFILAGFVMPIVTGSTAWFRFERIGLQQGLVSKYPL